MGADPDAKTSQPPVVFYDIASGPPVTSYAPNPWKTRCALNFKGVDYRTEWVDLPDVASVRKRLGAAPVRLFNDGEPFYTLPIVHDTTTGEMVGDSFDIAVYLDKTYNKNGEPSLFPSSSPSSSSSSPLDNIGLYAAFNEQVNAIFTSGIILAAQGLPLNPKTAEATKADHCRRFGVADWDAFTLRGEARKQALEAFEAYESELGKLAAFFKYAPDGGPFLAGHQATYADFIVGGWLMMLSVTLEEWDHVLAWHGGVWRRLHDALEPYRQIK